MKRLGGSLHFTVHPVQDPAVSHRYALKLRMRGSGSATIGEALAGRPIKPYNDNPLSLARQDVHPGLRPCLCRRSSHLHLDAMRRVASSVTKQSQIGVSEIGDL